MGAECATLQAKLCSSEVEEDTYQPQQTVYVKEHHNDSIESSELAGGPPTPSDSKDPEFNMDSLPPISTGVDYIPKKPSGIGGQGGASNNIYDRVSSKLVGVYSIDENKLDTKSVRKALGRRFASVRIVNRNQLQITFTQTGLSISEELSERSRSKPHVFKVVIVHHNSQLTGMPITPTTQSSTLKSVITLPPQIKKIECEFI